MKVAILGPLGTYTHEAAFKAFGSQVIYDERKSIADVFNSLSPILPLGVVPQENSIFGNVVETYDLLREANSSNFIRGEITLKVEHCLVVKKGVKLHHIQKVMSHEQALGQCRKFLVEKLPLAQAIKTQSTAAAAQALLNNTPDCAAICSSICATLFEGIEVLFTNIQNEQSNYTRFYISAHSRDMDLTRVLTKCQMKALFRISTPPQGPQPTPNEIVKYLKALDLRAARIDRRPYLNSKPFNSVYFVEVHGCSGGQGTDEMLKAWSVEVEKAGKRVKSEGGEVEVIGIW